MKKVRVLPGQAITMQMHYHRTEHWGVLRGTAVFSVKQVSPFSSSEFPIVIVGKSPLSPGLVRKRVPLLHPAA